MRDPDYPLRSHPVPREEVRLVRRYSKVDGEFVDELTMPLSTFRLEMSEEKNTATCRRRPPLALRSRAARLGVRCAVQSSTRQTREIAHACCR